MDCVGITGCGVGSDLGIMVLGIAAGEDACIVIVPPPPEYIDPGWGAIVVTWGIDGTMFDPELEVRLREALEVMGVGELLW